MLKGLILLACFFVSIQNLNSGQSNVCLGELTLMLGFNDQSNLDRFIAQRRFIFQQHGFIVEEAFIKTFYPELDDELSNDYEITCKLRQIRPDVNIVILSQEASSWVLRYLQQLGFSLYSAGVLRINWTMFDSEGITYV